MIAAGRHDEVTALSGTLTRMGARFEILDPCHPSFIQELAGFDVALSNLHGPFGEDGRLPADVLTAILHEALTRPRYDAPLPLPVFTYVPARESSSS